MPNNNQQPKKVTVEKGETLSGIAEREGVGASQWRDLEGIPENVKEDPTQLQPGTKLTIPQAGEGVEKEAKPDPIDGELDGKDFSREEDIPEAAMTEEERFVTGMAEQVDRERERLETRLKNERERINKETQEAEKERKETLEKQEELSEPFRQDLQEKKRKELYIEKNFEENQQLVDEMEGLLQEGNDLIQQQKEVTGLKAVRNPRIQKTMDEVTARVGVIEAVINARNGQIQQAQTMIDRSIGAIREDKNDQMNYYNTILDLDNQEILQLDEDSRQLAEEQTNLIKGDLQRAEQTAQRIKELMMNPGTAGLMGKAGVTLTDSPKEVNQKLSQAQYQEDVIALNNEMREQGAEPIYDPSGVPSEQLEEKTDSRGKTHYYKVDTTTSLSTSTLRILQGEGSLEDLTPSRRQEVEDELYEKGLSPYRSEPTGEFKDIMEDIMGRELEDYNIKGIWYDYKAVMREDYSGPDKAPDWFKKMKKAETGRELSGEELQKEWKNYSQEAETEEEDEITEETTAGEYFDDNEINEGAADSGMSIPEFRKLPIDEANKYISGGKESKSTSLEDIRP